LALIQIALQAQSRKCKLYPSTTDYTPSLLSYVPGPASARPALAQIEPSKQSHHLNPSIDVYIDVGSESRREAETPQLVKHPVSPAKKATEEAKASRVRDFKNAGSSLSGAPVASKCLPDN